MEMPKPIIAAIAIGIVLVSAGFLFSQSNNLFGKSAGMITGTIVLVDKPAADSGSSIAYSAPTVSLPGSTNCIVDIGWCSPQMFKAAANDSTLPPIPNLFKPANSNWYVGTTGGLNPNTMTGGYTYVSGGYPILNQYSSSGMITYYCMGRHYDTVVPGTYYVALANSFSIPAGSVPNTNGTIPTELPAVKFDGSMLDAQYASVSYSCS